MVPYPILVLSLWEIQEQQNSLPKTLPCAKGVHHKNVISEIQKKAVVSHTTLRNNSKAVEHCKRYMCKGTEFSNGAFDKKK